MDEFERFAGHSKRHFDRMDKIASLVSRAGYVEAASRFGFGRNGRRRPPEAGLPVPVIPPKGPLPLQGGAEAPLDFDRP